jgi:hypothetical protein
MYNVVKPFMVIAVGFTWVYHNTFLSQKFPAHANSILASVASLASLATLEPAL